MLQVLFLNWYRTAPEIAPGFPARAHPTRTLYCSEVFLQHTGAQSQLIVQ